MIRAENLSKRYRGNDALVDVTFAVPQGSVFALIGPNGAGKSTAIKVAMNLIEPSAGRVEVLGVDSRRLGRERLAQIGYVSENQKLPEWMRLDAFLEYCRAFYPAWDGALAAELLRQYDLPAGRKLSQLSRGMKVKAALAASLAYRPRLIVLDEPFGGLDVLVREQLIESLVDCTPDATIFLASHDLAEIESFASHVGYLDHGRLQFSDELESLSGRFREIVLTFDAAPALPARWPGTWLRPEVSTAVVRFVDTAFDPDATPARIAALWTPRDIAINAMPLRSIFIALAKSGRAAHA